MTVAEQGPATTRPSPARPMRLAVAGALAAGLVLGAGAAVLAETHARHGVAVSDRFEATVSQASSSGRGVCVTREGGAQVCGAPWTWTAAGRLKAGDKVLVLVEHTGVAASESGSDEVLVLLPPGPPGS